MSYLFRFVLSVCISLVVYLCSYVLIGLFL